MDPSTITALSPLVVAARAKRRALAWFPGASRDPVPREAHVAAVKAVTEPPGALSAIDTRGRLDIES